jgi:hypothetical protein
MIPTPDISLAPKSGHFNLLTTLQQCLQSWGAVSHDC